MPRRNNQPPHQRFIFTSSCKTKRRFSTERQANDAIEHQELLKPELVLSSYRCELCGGWHLTRRVSESNR